MPRIAANLLKPSAVKPVFDDEHACSGALWISLPSGVLQPAPNLGNLLARRKLSAMSYLANS